ncbi:MAG: hypothetical protein BAJALOKI3v1_370029 [Promethearchaeota archaeon]|nr:MAG: hypothetical protein BAJALOKI3v1_370029 [Candidatus Lokiarchaeota archaeon]
MQVVDLGNLQNLGIQAGEIAYVRQTEIKVFVNDYICFTSTSALILFYFLSFSKFMQNRAHLL